MDRSRFRTQVLRRPVSPAPSHRSPQETHHTPPPAPAPAAAKEESPAPPKAKKNRKKLWGSLLVVAAMLVAFGGGLLLAVSFGNSPPSVPEALSAKLKFEEHIPQKLPGDYKIDASSFSVDEDVLLYKATEGQSILTFTEQAKPKDLDFTRVYQSQLEDARTFNGLPSDTIWGKSLGNTVLSVVTDDSWVIMTTTTPLGEESLKIIAESIK